MAEFSQYIIPIPQPDVEEIFKVYETTYEFYQEVHYREALEDYCEWYYQVAEQHRQELESFKGDINLFRWFL